MNIKVYKLEIFIPKSHFELLQKALQESDAGHIGNYDSCLSYSEVIGIWRPLEKANPFIGTQNKLCSALELKVETICPATHLKTVIKAIKSVHPYEEPVINIIPLANGIEDN